MDKLFSLFRICPGSLQGIVYETATPNRIDILLIAAMNDKAS